MTETAKLTPSDGGQQNDWFGASVAIDGDTVAIAAPLSRLVKGAVYVFTKPDTGWKDMTETAELRSPSISDFGNVVAVSGDRIFANSSGYPDGFVCLYLKPLTGWVSTSHPDARLQWFSGHSAGFGDTIAVAGEPLIVGAPFAPVGYNYDRGMLLVLDNFP